MKKSGIFIFVFTFVAVICALFLRPQYMNLSRRFFGKVTSAIDSFADDFYATFNNSHLLEENEQLKIKLSYNNSYEVENKLIKQENEKLRKLLDLLPKTPYKNKASANVVGLVTTGKFYLIADKGQNHGIKAGDIALWGNALAGKVSESFSDFSFVTPISAPDVAVGIKNEEDDAGLISGKASLYQKNMCKLSFFSNTAVISSGKSIVTSGLSDTYPAGILVGKIQKENGDWVVKTEVDFFKIRTLQLISSG
ncbi:MAG: rod shape-determining protein MreC [Clostridia bacterium]|nr:rod shape-determining protein MreC [Clostridia bacterium]